MLLFSIFLWVVSLSRVSLLIVISQYVIGSLYECEPLSFALPIFDGVVWIFQLASRLSILLDAKTYFFMSVQKL